MRYKPLGKTGIETSEYGLGTWAMGGGIYGTADDAESIRTIHRAQDLGVNFLDTAPMYSISQHQDGRAEEIIGEAIKGRRDKWIVATKFGRHLNGNPDWWNMIEDYSGKRAIESTELSLKRMKTDYLDVLFVHSPPAQLFHPEDAFEGMEKLKKDGKIRALGFSFWGSVEDTLAQVEPFLRSGVLEVVQVIVNLLSTDAEDHLFPVIRETGTGVVAREALANSFLTDSFTAEGPFDPQDGKAGMKKEDIQAKLDKANAFKFLVEPDKGIPSLPAAALNWVVSHPEVSNVIPGSKTVEEIEQCLTAADATPFSSEEMAEVRKIQESWSE